MRQPPRFTLSSLLLRATAERPDDAAAASDTYESVTFSGLVERVERQAHGLTQAGIGPGDRVALWMPNSVDYLAAIFATAQLSAVAVHINTRFRAREVGDLLRRSGARVLVTDFRFEPVDFAAILAEMADEDVAALETIAVSGDARAQRIRGRPVAPWVSAGTVPDVAEPGAPCMTFTTSGTTAAPKLVLHAQRSIARHAVDVADAIGLRRDGAAALAMMPLCGTFGSAFATAAIAAGAHVVLMDKFDAARAVALIRQHRITHLAATDDVLRRLADEASSRRLDSIVFSGFASFSPAAVENIGVAAAAGLRPRALYGSSECQAFFAVAPEGDDVLRDGGVPVSSEATVAVRDVETNEPEEEGREGELCLAGPSLFDGYYGNAEATNRARTADGLFRSSDVATARGRRIFFHHRMGDTLRLGGFLVDPAEIESVLKGQGVAGAQVVAVEHDGKLAAVAFVTPAAGSPADPDHLQAACARDLARHKVPAKIIVVERFPMTDSPNGEKIQKAKLREMAREAMGD